MLKQLINSSEFTKNVVTLMTGTTIAQAIPVALSPVLSRIYTPDDFALLALYMFAVSIISTFITLKYELAIMLPDKNEDAANITVLSIFFAFVISIISFIIIICFNKSIVELLSTYASIKNNNIPNTLVKNNSISNWLYFIPFSVLFFGIFNSLNYWTNRKKQYKLLASSRIIQSSATIGVQIGAGSIGITPKGLLFGDIIGRLLPMLQLGKATLCQDKKYLVNISKKNMLQQIKRYKAFPLFSLPSDFINVFTNQIPYLLINKFFGGFIMGNYYLVDRILSVPITMVARAVLDVFKQRAGYEYSINGNCKEIFIKTFKTLLLLSIIPTLLLFFLSPYVFTVIFGKNWEIAGEFARIMSILFFFRFTISPLSYMLYIAERQIYDMFWQICLFLTTLLSFGIGIYLNNIKTALLCFSISYSVMYLFYLLLSYKCAKGDYNTTKK